MRVKNSLVVLGIAVLLLALPAGALACGMPLAARIPSEQALITFANGREQIIASVQLEADKPGAAVIFPVPAAPEVGVLERADLFDYLAEATRPELRITEVPSSSDGAPAGGAAGGVNVLGRDRIGGYDVARLAADDPNALRAWLDANGYRAPAGAEPILQAYIDEGWKFVAVKLAPDRPANGALAPLRMAFSSDRIVYPMRLGALADRPLDVLLYIAADHRVAVAPLALEYAGPTSQLSPAPPAEFAGLLRAPFLTKLRGAALDPAALTRDFVAEQAPDDAPFRKVESRVVYVPGAAPSARSMAGPIFGVVLVFIASLVSFGFALGLRRRINAIAGPDPDDQED